LKFLLLASDQYSKLSILLDSFIHHAFNNK
jgi:hypothetical protein